MTLITPGAGDGRPRTGPALTGIGLRAGVSIVACGAVRLGGGIALACLCHALAGTALIGRRASHGIRPDANPEVTGIRLCAEVPVGAGRAFRLRRTTRAVS